MRVVVVLEHRFFQTPDGRVWTDGPFPYSFFTRYLGVFDEALVAARAHPAERELAVWRRADGPGVRFAPTPPYVGAWEYLLRRTAIAAALRRSLEAAADAAVILRVPSEVASLAAAELRRQGRGFAVEVVADPHDAWSPGSSRHPLRSYLRWRQEAELRRLCGQAQAAGYVTEAALQRRYPAAPAAPTTHYSSVELPEEAFAAGHRSAFGGLSRLVHVGSLQHLYKGQDVLLEAVALCRDKGLTVEAKLIGEGCYRALLKRRRAELGLERSVTLPGGLPSGEAVRAELDGADLFVLPSRQEGLPRALLEAMARGLPAISTPVGGIPEVLPESDLVPVGDAAALADRIVAWARSPRRPAEAARRNLARARDFHEEALRGRRNELFQQIAASANFRQQPLRRPGKESPVASRSGVRS